MGKCLLQCILLRQNMIWETRPFHTKIDKFCLFLRIVLSLRLFSGKFEIYYLTNKFTATYKYKRPMGHVAHPRKQFKSIDTYNYHNKNQLSIL